MPWLACIQLFMHHMCRASCGEYRVLMLVSVSLRVDRVPQACPNVRTRSSVLVRLLHRVVLLPSGISGKMIISPDTITIIAMLVYRFYRLCLVAYHLLNISLSTMPWNLQPVRASKPLIGHVTACLTMLLVLLVAGVVASMWLHGFLVISPYQMLFNLMHLYTW